MAVVNCGSLILLLAATLDNDNNDYSNEGCTNETSTNESNNVVNLTIGTGNETLPPVLFLFDFFSTIDSISEGELGVPLVFTGDHNQHCI